MYNCYILKSKTSSKYYVGSTENLKERLRLYNSGRVTSTKKDMPWDLVYFEKFLYLREAMDRERQLKSWKSRVALENLVTKSRTLDFSSK